MNIFYKPKGPAKEYADDPIMRTDGWAANLYTGCVHGCRYCYVPDTPYWKFNGGKDRRCKFHQKSEPRKDILHKLELDCKRCAEMKEPVFLSFTSDIWQCDQDNSLTTEALLLFEKYGIHVNALTKGGLYAEQDFRIFERNPTWKFGTTLIFSLDASRKKWEPNASTVTERENAIGRASELGIYTWVSVEPVINPKQALKVISILLPVVDFWKVGKLNHGKKISKELGEIESSINWGHFLKDVEALIPKEKLLIKHDLEAHRRNF